MFWNKRYIKGINADVRGDISAAVRFRTFSRCMLGLVVSPHQAARGAVSVAHATVVLLGRAAQFMITANNLRNEAGVFKYIHKTSITTEGKSSA